MAAALFRSLLGADFEKLDRPVRWVHDGTARVLRGVVTVERGLSLVAKVLGALTALPPVMTDAALEVRIEPTGRGERWIRIFGASRPMCSSLYRRGEYLTEELGPAVLRFHLRAQDDGLRWILARISVAGIPLPRRCFVVTAGCDARDGRYHFLVELALRGMGRIVKYEGLLDAKH
jgi:hypothetical protein